LLNSKINEANLEKQTLFSENNSLMKLFKEFEEKKELEKKDVTKIKNFESQRFISFSNEVAKFLQNFNIFRVIFFAIFY